GPARRWRATSFSVHSAAPGTTPFSLACWDVSNIVGFLRVWVVVTVARSSLSGSSVTCAVAQVLTRLDRARRQEFLQARDGVANSAAWDSRPCWRSPFPAPL